MKLSILFFSLLLAISSSAMKGRLLLVGGGSEQVGGWSNAPYQWAVNHAANKRVAIISYADAPSTFLSDYFKNTLGAVKAKDFKFSTRDLADLQSTYDSLMTYDLIFFRGGDQSEYYFLYKNTKLAQAINDKFNEGGVIAGTSAGLHILSSVAFTAQYQSINSLAAISNITSESFTLDTDLFNLFPDYVFDSHVAERGRFPRTLSFLANYFITKNKKINAIAVDDLTALGIDTNEVGTAFGTGAIGIYKITSTKKNPFIIDGQKPLSDFVSVTQLLNTWKYNFRTHKVIGFKSDTITIKPAKLSNSNPINSTILVSGDDNPAFNTKLLSQLIDSLGQASDSILIVSHSTASPSYSSVFAASISGISSAKTRIFNVDNQASGDTSLRGVIRGYSKILLTGTTSTLFNYLVTDTCYGKVILKTIKEKVTGVAFTGKTSRLVGKSVVSDNYLTVGDANYFSELTSSKGLNLIPNSLVLPYSFLSATNNGYFENQACSVPYFMMKDTCQFGLMIHGDMVLKYGIKNTKRFINANGAIPAILFKCDSTKRAFSSTTSRNTGTPRQVAGFSQMKVAFIGTMNPYFLASGIEYKDTLLYNNSTLTGFGANYPSKQPFNIYPNPTNSFINMDLLDILSEFQKVTLIDFTGNRVYESDRISTQIPVYGLPNGIYILMIRNGDNVYQSKVMIGSNE